MLIDKYFPSQGPCAFCGQDARHRVIDAIRELLGAGDRVEPLAEDYGKSQAAVMACVGLDVPDLRRGDPVVVNCNGWRERPLKAPNCTFLRYLIRPTEAAALVKVPGGGYRLALLDELEPPF